MLRKAAPDARGGFPLFSLPGLRRSIALPLFLLTLANGARPGGLAFSQAPSDDLKIVIIEGDGFVNNVRKRTARDPVVEVRDRNNKPIAGAAVTFLLPQGGPSGTFANGLNTITVQTNAAGRAVATGFTPNQVTGPVQMQVEANYQGQTARATIRGRNLTRNPWRSWKKWVLGGSAVAVAVVVVVVVTRGSHSQVQVGPPRVGTN